MPVASLLSQAVAAEHPPGDFQHDSDSAARRRERLERPAALGRLAGHLFDRIRPYGFILLYALMLSGGLDYLVIPPYNFVRSWLP